MPTKVLSGGKRLEAKLAMIASAIQRGAVLKVGFLAGATYPDGKPVAMIAAIQNFGAPRVGIPPRPFFTNMIKNHAKEWPVLIMKQLKATDYDVNKTMNQVGAVMQGQLRLSIRDTNAPPLSPVTLMVRQIVGPNGTPKFKDVLEARRRVAAGEQASGVSTKTLIWTSFMLKSVNWNVDEL